jgi:3-phosphoshikimate 1-carboxyvinyltransferase
MRESVAGTIRIRSADSVRGRVRVPGDKSIAHRALILSAVADGDTVIHGLPTGHDVVSTMTVLSGLGIGIDGELNTGVCVRGRGFSALQPPSSALNCGNSGTTMRLMMGLLAGRPFAATLCGDGSLSRRPMARISTPLAAMGAQFELADGTYPPIQVTGGPLTGMSYQTPVASAQIKSAVLIAGLQASGMTTVIESSPSRDHTERMLAEMGVGVERQDLATSVTASPLQSLERYEVPGDISSAAFLLTAALVLPDSAITIEGVGFNATRLGFWEIVQGMGARIHAQSTESRGEPIATIQAMSSSLQPFDLRGSQLVRAIDEVPILAVLATQASGRSVIADAAELRVKESDRIATTAAMLRGLGAAVQETADGLVIDGPTPLKPGVIECHNDHRIALAGAIAGLIARGDGWTELKGGGCAAVSYPGFFEDVMALSSAVVEECLS